MVDACIHLHSLGMRGTTKNFKCQAGCRRKTNFDQWARSKSVGSRGIKEAL